MSRVTGSSPHAPRTSKTKPKGATKAKGAARPAKSAKADGTPKKRWTPDERKAKGLAPRRGGGQSRSFEPRARDESESTRPRKPGERQAPAGREDRPARTEWRPREDRPARDDRAPRTEWRPREDRPAREDRAPRTEWRPREDRPAREDRAPRTEWRPREDRPRWQAHADAPRRTHWGERSAERPDRRDDRGRGPRREGFDRPKAAAEADSDLMEWTESEVSTKVAAAPAGSGKGFADLGLPAELAGALAAQGITTPFPIQAATIPDALAGKDILGRGRTGSGKTLSFGLPLLARLAKDRKGTGVRAVVLVPTRELALQVADVLSPLARTVGLSLTLVAGGMPYGPQLRAFERGVDIVVATPGRLIDLMEQGAADLSGVVVTVLDEADHMADLGFWPAVTTIVDQTPADGQRLLFSATLDTAIDALVKRYLHDPVTHEVDPDRASVGTMHHEFWLIAPHHKNELAARIAGRPGRTIVFVRTQLGADRVATQLRAAGVMAGSLHGGLTQGARSRIMAAFRSGNLPVLVATDVAARGIHVDDVSVVLQLDPPMNSKDYLHRSGRTARAGETGLVLSLVLPHQRKTVASLAGHAGVHAEPVPIKPGDRAVDDALGSEPRPSGPVSDADYESLIAPPKQAPRRPRDGARQGKWSGGRERSGGRARF